MSFSVPEMRKLMFPGVEAVSDSEWWKAAEALKRVGWMNDKQISHRNHWYLTDWKVRNFGSCTEVPPKFSLPQVT